jgi:hypothetical protein
LCVFLFTVPRTWAVQAWIWHTGIVSISILIIQMIKRDSFDLLYDCIPFWWFC